VTDSDGERPGLVRGRSVGEKLGWAIAILLAAASIARLIGTGKGWMGALISTAMAVGYTFLPWLRAATARAQARRARPAAGSVTLDDWGVTRVVGDVREAIAWSEIVWVRVYTTSEGPIAEDVFFALGGADGKGCLVPHGLAVEVDLVAALQRRLPALDNEALIRAMGSATDAVFTIWERDAPAPAPVKPKSDPN
jgi:hypothetical protein